MNLFGLVVVGLAVWQAVEIYHHSKLFADVRAEMDLNSDLTSDISKCPWCLSIWVGLVFAFWWYTMPEWFQFPLFALAVSRLANIANDLTYNYCRTPKEGEDINAGNDSQGDR